MAAEESLQVEPLPLIQRLSQEHARVFFFSLGKLGKNPIAALLTALVVGVALALPAGMYVLTSNINAVSYSWQESLQLSLFLKDSVSAERGAALARDLRNRAGVAKTQYISREQSLEEFRQQSGFGEALDIIKTNPLPAVISVSPERGRNKLQVEVLLGELTRLPEVDLAKLDQKWLERLYAVLAIIERAVFIVGLLLGIAVVVTIGNTIRLDIEARREEISVMKLIGAPDSFIRRPFLYTGFWYGLGGGVLALMLVLFSTLALAGPSRTLAGLYDSSFTLAGLSFTDSLLLLGTGVALGWLGAWLTVWRHLADIQPQ
ncbi:MAG TPA: permease-like cell division protein FtsX [Solimonas sp.]|nr:permease-like cell division protein FtsX [Solimonas sp.]